MRSGLIGEAFYISWRGIGVQFKDIVETNDDITFYISVPSSSYNIDAKGNEMSGIYLAKRFKEVLIDMGMKNLIVKVKIRDEVWTKEKDNSAYQAAKKELYRSQA